MSIADKELGVLRKSRWEKAFNVLFRLFLIGGWTAATLSFDYYLACDTIMNLRAVSYPTVPGVVLSSVPRPHPSSNLWRAKIHYQYAVNGSEYKSESIRYNTAGKGAGKGETKALVDTYPVGGNVKVYFNPSNPADAILQPGFEGFYLNQMLYFFPVNLIMIAGWSAMALGTTLASGRQRKSNALQIKLQMGILIAALPISIFSFLVLMVISWTVYPSLPVMIVAWLIVLLAGLKMIKWGIDALVPCEDENANVSDDFACHTN
jgi:hypothetical protein